MFRIIWISVRNLRRHRVRTAIAILAVALGLSLVIFTSNLNAGSYDQMIDKGIRGISGHVVVMHEDYLEEEERQSVVEDSTRKAAALGDILDGCTVTRRIFAAGLATSSHNNAPVALLGIDPITEGEIGNTDEKLVELCEDETCRPSQWLDPDDDQGILLGDVLAARLGVGINDRVVIMAADPVDPSEGTSLLFRVRGAFHTGSDMLDGFTAITTIGATQPLLAGSDPVHQISAVSDDGQLPDASVMAARSTLNHGTDTVYSWDEALSDLNAFVRVDKRTNDIFFFIIGLMVVLGVLNTILMGVLERTREFGVMMALGMRPHLNRHHDHRRRARYWPVGGSCWVRTRSRIYGSGRHLWARL